MSQHKSKKRIVIIIASAVVVLGAAGVLVYFFVFKAASPTDSTANPSGSKAGQQLSEKNEALRTESLTILQTEGAQASQKKLDEALQTSSDSKDKAYIYSLKASVASAGGNAGYQDALTYAYEAEKLNPTYETALTIAELEYELNNKPNAIKYYKLYLERSVTSDGTLLDAAGRTFYENKLKELEA